MLLKTISITFILKQDKLKPLWVNGLKRVFNRMSLFVDPPRKGLDDSFIESIIEANPEKIVYVSCNPTTMARDIAKFVHAGYDFEQVQPLDMFPQTWHVEADVLMTSSV